MYVVTQGVGTGPGEVFHLQMEVSCDAVTALVLLERNVGAGVVMCK